MCRCERPHIRRQEVVVSERLFPFMPVKTCSDLRLQLTRLGPKGDWAGCHPAVGFTQLRLGVELTYAATCWVGYLGAIRSRGSQPRPLPKYRRNVLQQVLTARTRRVERVMSPPVTNWRISWPPHRRAGTQFDRSGAACAMGPTPSAPKCSRPGKDACGRSPLREVSPPKGMHDVPGFACATPTHSVGDGCCAWAAVR